MKTGFIFVSPLRFAALGAGLTLGVAAPASAQPPPPPPVPAAVEDNSFFVEEAYNQEPGVVQHVSTLLRPGDPESRREYRFSQEWPIRGQTHQLSYSVPYSWLSGSGGTIDRLTFDYRYQLADRTDWAAVAPRLSLIATTSRDRPDRDHPLGFQLNVPVSKRVGGGLALHANVGATFFAGAVERGWNLGASLIGPVTRRLNLMLEVAVVSALTPDEAGALGWQTETVLSPGLRWAIDVGALQVVPGLAVPLIVREGRADVGALFYLSFEHPFGR